MTHTRLAYMPLATYPEAADDAAILATLDFAGALGCAVQVKALAVDLPRVSSGLGDYLMNVPGVIQAAEERSRSECERLRKLVEDKPAGPAGRRFASRTLPLGIVAQSAAVEARYFDFVLLPWNAAGNESRNLVQELVFEAGRPTILVPAGAPATPLAHLAVAWDGSRVAARALGDALALLPAGGQVSVITVEDEKPLAGRDIGSTLVSWLSLRGYNATAVTVPLGRQTISEALQAAARSSGAQLLAMGGFGHSRLRDFILGGATQGVMAGVELPVLLSH